MTTARDYDLSKSHSTADAKQVFLKWYKKQYPGCLISQQAEDAFLAGRQDGWRARGEQDAQTVRARFTTRYSSTRTPQGRTLALLKQAGEEAATAIAQED